MRPLRFVLPHQAGLRPAWMLRAGLFLYDHSGGRQRLPGTRVLDLATDSAGAPLKPGVFTTGFEYSDCWVDDARLVVLNARDAAERGAAIRTRTRAVAASRDAGHVAADRRGCRHRRARDHCRARARQRRRPVGRRRSRPPGWGATQPGQVRLVQGSHIVVPKLFDHDRAYIFQRPDGRIVFAIPYEGEFTLIGTTDRDYAGDPAAVSATPEEIAYLCEAASAAFARSVLPADVVWTYSGVRPLYDDGAGEAKAASRDYVLEMDDEAGRRAAAVDHRRQDHDLSPPGRGRAGAAGGAPARAPGAGGRLDRHHTAARWRVRPRRAARADPAPGAQLSVPGSRPTPPVSSRAYGARAARMLGRARSAAELGRDFGATLTEAEVRYLIEQEWAATAEDMLWRRTKLGLHLSRDQARRTRRLDARSNQPGRRLAARRLRVGARQPHQAGSTREPKFRASSSRRA